MEKKSLKVDTTIKKEGDMKGVVQQEDLYQFCSELGLMLYWGIPMVQALEEMEQSLKNPLMKEITGIIKEGYIRGDSTGDIFSRFPSVFKPVIIKWAGLGARYGILDYVMLNLAGIIRFDQIITKRNSPLPAKELGDFFLRLSSKLKENGEMKSDDTAENLLTEEIRLYSKGNPLIQELMKEINFYKIPVSGERGITDVEEGGIFKGVCERYNISPLLKEIAPPLMWHLLESAEEGGYLADMLEVLGLYLNDRNNLYSTKEPVEIPGFLIQGKNFPLLLAKKILELIVEDEEKRGEIIKDGDSFNIVVGGITKPLVHILEFFCEDNGLKPKGEREASDVIHSVVGHIKYLLQVDPAEKRLSQKTRIQLFINDKNYTVITRVQPPFPFPQGNKMDFSHLIQQEEKIEIKIVDY